MTAGRTARGRRDEFTHLSSRWDETFDATLVTLHPGDYFVAEKGEFIATLLGSCVSACIRDCRLGIGGMNHFMLPIDQSNGENGFGDVTSASTRFGNVAMEVLINGILKRGGHRTDLEVKLVGGARVLDLQMDVGARNVQFVREYARAEGFQVLAEDLGGQHARKVVYDPRSGTVRVKHLARTERSHIADDERQYQQRIDHTPVGGDVELFED
jgi:chemotaxis protein CheD